MTYPLEPVESSNVAACAYDGKSKTLTLKFKNGSTYEYYNVPAKVGDAFPFLESKGKGVWSLLRGHYSYSRVG